MGNTCCTTRVPESASANMTPMGGTSQSSVFVTPAMELQFRSELLEKYKFHRIDFSTFGSQLEAAILVETENTASSKPKLLQKFNLSENVMMNRRVENQLEALRTITDPKVLFENYYKRHNGVYYMTADFLGQGTRDLYMLANIKGAFSENEIGQIAE